VLARDVVSIGRYAGRFLDHATGTPAASKKTLRSVTLGM
jgi:hypothetical protein